MLACTSQYQTCDSQCDALLHYSVAATYLLHFSRFHRGHSHKDCTGDHQTKCPFIYHLSFYLLWVWCAHWTLDRGQQCNGSRHVLQYTWHLELSNVWSTTGWI